MPFDLEKYTSLIELRKKIEHIEAAINGMKRSDLEIYMQAYSPLIVAIMGAIVTIFVAYKMFEKNKAKDQALKQIDVDLKLNEARSKIYGELMDSYMKTRDVFRKQFTDLLNLYLQKGLHTMEEENPTVDGDYEILNGITDKINKLSAQYEVDSKEHQEVYSNFIRTYSSYVFLKNGTTELEAQFATFNPLLNTLPANDFYEKHKTIAGMEQYYVQQQTDYDQLWLNTITPQGREFLRTVLDNR